MDTIVIVAAYIAIGFLLVLFAVMRGCEDEEAMLGLFIGWPALAILVAIFLPVAVPLWVSEWLIRWKKNLDKRGKFVEVFKEGE